VQTAEVTFWGLCPACRDAEDAPLDGEVVTGPADAGAPVLDATGLADAGRAS
jgi:Fur family ferric uptake transcriptional regulator